MARNQVFYISLVRGPPVGFAVDNCIILRDENMRNAVDRTHQRAITCLANIEQSRNRPVQHFYIGKTHIRARQDREFDPTDTTSWDMRGIMSRFQSHRQTHYGRDGLIVLAVVTRNSIPADCMDMQYIIHQEEYTLILERRLIERFTAAGDQRLANRGTDPGNTDHGASPAYVVYMTFTIDDKAVDATQLKLHIATTADTQPESQQEGACGMDVESEQREVIVISDDEEKDTSNTCQPM